MEQISSSRQPQPLAGIRVLDLTRLLPGAYCTQMLADMGAEIIKIEQPGTGDYWRWMDPKVRRHGYQFLALNRGKKSVTLDLKNADGRDAFIALCKNADVVFDGFRPGVMKRLGLDSDSLQALYPGLVYCAMSGFGQYGPDSLVAAHDLNYQGMTGLLHYVNGSTQRPRVTALPVADLGGGALMAIAGILAALVERERTGKGRTVDISVVDGLLSWAGFMTSKWNVPGQPPEDTPFDEPFDKPFYTVYETQDGRHLVVGAYEPKFWETLCEVLSLADWIDRQWVTGAQEAQLRGLMADAFRTKTQAEWMQIFSKREACVTPVLSIREALAGSHARARGSVITVQDPLEGDLRHIACPIRFDGVTLGRLEPCPTLGQQTESLLREAGLGAEKISALRGQGAV
jgi:alpha-methylacyl-CoA racemase